MNHNMCKVLSLLIVCLTLLLSFGLISCENKKKNPVTPTTENPGTQPPDDPEENWDSYLPEETYGWEDVNIVILRSREWQYFVDDEVEEMSSIENAVFKRNKAVEERYEVYLNYEVKEQDIAALATICTNSGSYDYDIFSPDYWYGLEAQNAFIDLNQCSQLHLSNPYWVAGWNNNATVNGKILSAVGYFSLDPIAQEQVLFFNGALAQAYGYTDLYQKVYDKEWTLDAMLGMMKEATQDIDGDTSTLSFEDQFGLSYDRWGCRAFLYGCGMQLASYENDTIDFQLTSQKNIGIFESVYSFLKESNAAYDTDGDRYGEKGSQALFTGGRALFYACPIEVADVIRGKVGNYGVLPMPLLNSDQEDYITSLLGTTTCSIFKTCPNIDRAASILEALCIITYRDVVPKYYEDCLKFEYQNDPEVAGMLDFIRSRVNVDFMFINDAHFQSICSEPGYLIRDGKKGEYVSTMTGFTNLLPELKEKFLKLFE